MRRGILVAALAATLLMLTAAMASASAPGDLDPTFSDDGVFIDPLGDPGPAGRPGADFYAVARQSDGKLVAAGQGTPSQIIIVRFNEDGTLDPSFGSGGRVLTKFGLPSSDIVFSWSLAVAPDGKILLGGMDFVGGGPTAAFFARLTNTGAPDDGFGTAGVVVRQYGEGASPYSSIEEIKVLPDGRIAGAGSAKAADGHAAAMVVRLDSAGAQDGAFGTAGKALHQFGTGANYDSQAKDLAIQPDGKILITGVATDTDDSQADAAFVARLDAEGQGLDGSYGTGGKLVGRFGGPAPAVSSPRAIDLQPDGKAVLAGSFTTATGNARVLVTRIRADGTALDSDFGTGGTYSAQLGGAISSFGDVDIQPDGKLVLTGTANCQTGSSCVLIARLLDTGVLDPSFGVAGKFVQNFGGNGYESHTPHAVLDPAGKLVAVGGASFNVNGNYDTHALALRVILNNPPTAAMTATPTALNTGEPVTFSDAGSADSDGSIVEYSWDFGDGASGTGAAVSHAYATAGPYAAKLTVRDNYGLIGSTSQAITVNAVPGQQAQAPRDTTAPVVSGLAFSPSSFAVAKAATALVAKRVPRGSAIKFQLSEAASVAIKIVRELPGMKSGKRCVAPRKGKKARKAKRCTRLKTLGTLARTGIATANKVTFSGRLGKRALGVGRYRATVLATDATGNKSKPATAKFKIIPSR